jgi:hypothetical protein
MECFPVMYSLSYLSSTLVKCTPLYASETYHFMQATTELTFTTKFNFSTFIPLLDITTWHLLAYTFLLN